jgi:hypothetical protein
VSVPGWFERRGEIPLAPPARVREYGPLSDDPDRADANFEDRSVRGIAFVLEYCDSRGWVSTRTIRCLALDPTAPMTLQAYCNVRGTTRSFRLDRIVAIGDLRTGRVFREDQHAALLGGYCSGDDKPDGRARVMAEARRATVDGVVALLHLAMPDGRLEEKARSAVLGYVRAEIEAVGAQMPAADLIELWIDNLSPPLDMVLDAVSSLLEDKERFARFLPWLLKVMRTFDTYSQETESVRDLLEAVRAHYASRPPLRAPTRALR